MYYTKDVFSDIYNVMECPACKAYYLSPHPTDTQLKRAYDDTYYGEGEEKFNPIVEFILDYFRGRRSAFVRKHVKEGGRILDIGCGNGRFLKYLGSKGKYELHGIEREGNSARRAAQIKGVNLHVGVLQKDLFPSDYFDAITLFHVFEHLDNPSEVLDMIGQILKPTGVLVMSFPNIGSNQAKWFEGEWLHLDPPRHLFFFKPNDIKSIMEKRGFLLVNESYVSMEQNPYGLIQSILNALSSKREVLYEYLKGNQDYLKDYSKVKVLLHLAFAGLMAPLAVVLDWLSGLSDKGATVQFTWIKK